MTTPIVLPPGIGAGDIEFYDRITPPLQASPYTYTLSATQQIRGLAEGAVGPYPLQQTFLVSGPRFTIDPATIHSVFPPSNQLGHWDFTLPSIVFKDFALPWMRSIVDDGHDNPDGPPWMALLTVYQAEMAAAPDKPANPNAMLTFPTTIQTGALVNPPSGIVGPLLPDVQPNDTTPVSVIDVDGAFFNGIAPKGVTELPYLAHARAVNTGGKVLLGMNEDGCFSVVVGNRMPQAGPADTPVRNTVLLVSLEGHLTHLPDGSAAVSSGKIRLVVLGMWSFLSAPARGSFVELMQDVCAQGGVQLLRLGAPTDPKADAMAAEALAIGYVPLGNDLRVGETTTSLYRGPFAAGPTAPDSAYGPYYFSDSAIFYDLDYGIFNDSYAAAWQVGRLLALSDAAFVQAISDWRRAYAAKHRDQANRAAVVVPTAQALAGAHAGAAPPGDLMTEMRGFFAQRMHAGAERLPAVTPRFERVAAAHPAVGVAAVDVDADPLVALRARLARLSE